MAREERQLARFIGNGRGTQAPHRVQGTALDSSEAAGATKHQYTTSTRDGSTASSLAPLDHRIPAEPRGESRHPAGHSFHHEVAYATSHGKLGSVDANRGDPQNGWGHRSVPELGRRAVTGRIRDLARRRADDGGFKLRREARRQSLDRNDLFHGPHRRHRTRWPDRSWSLRRMIEARRPRNVSGRSAIRAGRKTSQVNPGWRCLARGDFEACPRPARSTRSRPQAARNCSRTS